MPDVIYEKRDGVATITLNRPERRNAFSPESIIRLAEAWIDYRDDDDLRVAILTGAGDQAFCAGGDLGSLLPLFTGVVAHRVLAAAPVTQVGARVTLGIAFTGQQIPVVPVRRDAFDRPRRR